MTVSVWSGLEADVLREAMQCGEAEFAKLAGVSERTVGIWKRRGGVVRLRWDIQQRLDRLLSTAKPLIQQRFETIRQQSPGRVMLTPRAPRVQIGLFRCWKAVGYLHIAYQAGRSRDAMAMVPHVLGHTEVSPALASSAHHVASALCLQLGDLPAATIAAQRCHELAQASGVAVHIAASARSAVRVLMREGKNAKAMRLAIRAADFGAEKPKERSVRGSLLLLGSVAAARCGNRAQAHALLQDAAAEAHYLGRDANFGWTSFGPSNVRLHQADVLTTLGEPSEALKTTVTLENLTAERQARYFMERARAWAALGDPTRALNARKQAQWVAPGLLNG